NTAAMDLPLDEVGAIAAWTPFGAATGWATGSIVKLLIALATLALGVWLWWRDIEEAPVQAKDHDKADLRIPLVPDSPSGIGFALSVRYVFRDTRLLFSVLVRPSVVVVRLVQSIAPGVPVIWYVALFVCALISGGVGVNGFGDDGPAMWVTMM